MFHGATSLDDGEPQGTVMCHRHVTGKGCNGGPLSFVGRVSEAQRETEQCRRLKEVFMEVDAEGTKTALNSYILNCFPTNVLIVGQPTTTCALPPLCPRVCVGVVDVWFLRSAHEPSLRHLQVSHRGLLSFSQCAVSPCSAPSAPPQ